MEERYFKDAFKLYRSNFSLKSSLSAIYGVIVILVLSGAFFLPATLILTVPLILLPSTFAYQMANSGINNKIRNPIQLFFVFFGLYYRMLLFGNYRAIFGFLKAFVTYSVYTTIGVIILVIVLSNSNPQFIEILNKFSMDSSMSIATLIDSLLAIPEFVLGEFIILLVAFGFGSYAFIHHILTSSIKFHLALSNKQPMMYRQVNALHRMTFPKIRKVFYFNYYSVATPLAILFLSGYVAGSLVSYFYFGVYSSSALIVGLFIGFILNLLFLPLLFDMIEVIYQKERIVYANTLIEFASKAFDDLKKQNALSPEDIKAAEEALKKGEDELTKKNDNPEDK